MDGIDARLILIAAVAMLCILAVGLIGVVMDTRLDHEDRDDLWP